MQQHGAGRGGGGERRKSERERERERRDFRERLDHATTGTKRKYDVTRQTVQRQTVHVRAIERERDSWREGGGKQISMLFDF